MTRARSSFARTWIGIYLLSILGWTGLHLYAKGAFKRG